MDYHQSSDINLRAILQQIPQASITKNCLKIAYLKFNLHLPGANELIYLKLAIKLVSRPIQRSKKVIASKDVPINSPTNQFTIGNSSTYDGVSHIHCACCRLNHMLLVCPYPENC